MVAPVTSVTASMPSTHIFRTSFRPARPWTRIDHLSPRRLEHQVARVSAAFFRAWMALGPIDRFSFQTGRNVTTRVSGSMEISQVRGLGVKATRGQSRSWFAWALWTAPVRSLRSRS